MLNELDRSIDAQSVVSLPGAGRRTLLSALDGVLSLPDGLRLCLLDAGRMETPEQNELLKQLAASEDRTIFVLNKADLVGNPQTLVTRTLDLLREQGFESPELYLICAEAAKRFRQIGAADLPQKEPMELELLFNRFRPDANDLSAFSVTEEPVCKLGGRTVSAVQLARALENTGVPALEARLRALSALKRAWPGMRRTAEAEQGNVFDLFDDALFSTPAQSAEAVFEAQKTPPTAPEVPVPTAGTAAALSAVSTLEELRELARRADCVALHQMMTAVQAGELLPDCSREAMDFLYPAFEVREKWELQTLTDDLDTLELDELLRRQDRINHSVYVLQTRAPYAERILARIEQKQTERLEALCEGLEAADLAEVKRIRNRVEAFECSEVLKQPFFEHLDEREDVLGREALERFTADAEGKSVKELRRVEFALASGNWNPRVVVAFRHKIALLIEAASFHEVQAELVGLNDMERREVVAVQGRITDKPLPPRFTAAAMTQIDERLYRMDMLRLIAMNNDFDRLDFAAIDDLRLKVKYSDACPAAKNAYLKILQEREKNCALEHTFGRVNLVRKLFGKRDMRSSDIKYAEKTQDYETQASLFLGSSRDEAARDLPVFILHNASDFAFSGTLFYYKDGDTLKSVPLKDVLQFEILTERMKQRLRICCKENSNWTEAQISRRGAQRTLDFLNECLLRWNEPGLDRALPSPETHIAPVDPKRFLQPVPPVILNREQARSIFQDDLAAAKNYEGFLVRKEDPGSAQRVQKVLQAFGLPDATKLIWFGASTVLGAIRSGVALSESMLYVKENKQPVIAIDLQEIYQMEPLDKKHVKVTTDQNQKLQLHLAGDMAKPIADYVRAVQLSAYLRSLEERNE